MKKLGLSISLVLCLLTACSKNNSEDNEKASVDANELFDKMLDEGVWICNDQLSDLYEANGIHETTYLLFWKEEGKQLIELCEGSGLSRACITNGSYNFDLNNKTVRLNGISNPNCSWLSILNTRAMYDEKQETLTFNTLGGPYIFKHELPQ